MPTHAVLSLYIWQIYHNTWIFPGLESRERLSDPKQKVFLITITTKGKQNQCNPKAGEDEVLKIRIQREPVLICLQIMKIKLRNYRHNFLERCHIKTYGISRSKDDDWKQDKSMDWLPFSGGKVWVWFPRSKFYTPSYRSRRWEVPGE